MDSRKRLNARDMQSASRRIYKKHVRRRETKDQPRNTGLMISVHPFLFVDTTLKMPCLYYVAGEICLGNSLLQHDGDPSFIDECEQFLEFTS